MTEAIDQLATALAAAQAEMNNAAFNRINPHYKSQYADLAAIRDATLPALNANGLSLVQYTTSFGQDNDVLLTTMLMHKSGQYIKGDYPITRGTPQAMGSQLTYAKRYCWSAMLGIAADDDDDAEVAEVSAKAGNKRATEKKSAYKSRKDGDWESLKAEMAAINTAHALKVWRVANSERIHALPNSWQVHFTEEYERHMAELSLKDEMAVIGTAHGLKVWGVANSERIHALPDSWQARFREEYERRMTELREGVTEEGSPLKQQLKASLEAEDAEVE